MRSLTARFTEWQATEHAGASLRECLDYCRSLVSEIRMDTHEKKPFHAAGLRTLGISALWRDLRC